MKRLVFYGRRQMAMAMLPFLVALGHEVKVISEDYMVSEMAWSLDLETVTLDTMGEFDYFICCHGSKIIDKKYLVPGKFINIHPCLYKYKGHNPIKRYLKNWDTQASVESQYLIEEVDAGEVLVKIAFQTPILNTYADFYNLALPYYFECLEKTLQLL